MDVLVLVIEIVLCLFALFMIAVVLLQSGKSAGLSGDIGGAAEQLMGKSKAKSYERTLKTLTKIVAISIMLLAIGLVVIQVYFMPSEDNLVLPEATPAVEESQGPEDLVAPVETPLVTE